MWTRLEILAAEWSFVRRYSSSDRRLAGSAPPKRASRLLGAGWRWRRWCRCAIAVAALAPPSADSNSGNARSSTRPFSAASASSASGRMRTSAS